VFGVDFQPLNRRQIDVEHVLKSVCLVGVQIEEIRPRAGLSDSPEPCESLRAVLGAPSPVIRTRAGSRSAGRRPVDQSDSFPFIVDIAVLPDITTVYGRSYCRIPDGATLP
jgi:hypothetical protein